MPATLRTWTSRPMPATKRAARTMHWSSRAVHSIRPAAIVWVSAGPVRGRTGMTTKRIIIAGPNGAGKTTFATEFLPNEAECPVFISADLIAAGLSPFRPELAAIRAGRLMLREMAATVALGASFAFETTLAGTRYARAIPHWQEVGYHVTLIFL